MNIATLEPWADQNYVISDLAISILETYYNASYAHNPVKLQNNQGRVALSSNNEKASLPYPNPADDLLTIKYALKEGDIISIFSVIGSKITELEIKTDINEYQLKTDLFNSGIYYLVIQNLNGTANKFKFSIIH